jgi:hypothetical protein
MPNLSRGAVCRLTAKTAWNLHYCPDMCFNMGGVLANKLWPASSKAWRCAGRRGSRPDRTWCLSVAQRRGTACLSPCMEAQNQGKKA